MIPKRFHASAFLIAFAAALVALLVTSLQMLEARASAQDAVDNLARCQKLSARIHPLRELAAVATETGQVSSVRSSEIAQIAEREGIKEKQIASIDRLPAEQVLGSEYQREDAILRLVGVSMEQLVRCLIAIQDRGGELLPTVIVLRPERSRATTIAGQEAWAADVTLTRLLYVATNPPGQ